MNCFRLPRSTSLTEVLPIKPQDSFLAYHCLRHFFIQYNVMGRKRVNTKTIQAEFSLKMHGECFVCVCADEMDPLRNKK